jgi:hypothetical protein
MKKSRFYFCIAFYNHVQGCFRAKNILWTRAKIDLKKVFFLHAERCESRSSTKCLLKYYTKLLLQLFKNVINLFKLAKKQLTSIIDKESNFYKLSKFSFFFCKCYNGIHSCSCLLIYWFGTIQLLYDLNFIFFLFTI